VKATTVTPVVEPDVTLTMTMQEARNWWIITGHMKPAFLAGMFPGFDGDRIDEMYDGVEDMYSALLDVVRYEDE